MPNQNHIEVIDRLHRGLEAGNAAPADVDGLVQDFENIYSQANGEVRGRLARLRQVIGRHIDTNLEELSTATVSRESLRKLRDEMDRRLVMANHPESQTFGVGNYLQAGINRYTLFERENPDRVNYARVGLAVAALPVAYAAVSVVSGVVYTIYKGIKLAITRPLEAIAAVTGALGSYALLRTGIGNLPESVRRYIPNWIGGTGGAQQPSEKLSQEEIKKREELWQAQRTRTDGYIQDARSETDPKQKIVKVVAALSNIRLELQQVGSLPSNTQRVDRSRFLNEVRAEMLGLLPPDERKKYEQDEKQRSANTEQLQQAQKELLDVFNKRLNDLRQAAETARATFQSSTTAQNYENAFFALNEVRGHLRNIQQVLTGVPEALASGIRANATTGLQDVEQRETALQTIAAGTPAAERAQQLRDAVQNIGKTITTFQENTDVNSLMIEGIRVERRVDIVRGYLWLDGNQVQITGDGMVASINRIQRRGNVLYCEATVFGTPANFSLSAHDIVRMIRLYREGMVRAQVVRPGWGQSPYRQIDERVMSVNGVNRTIRTRILTA